MGFGMTTVLLNIHNAGFFPVSAMVLAMGIFYGGIAQIIAGIMEFKKGNTFGTTAFISYGLFWLTLVALWVIPGTGAPNGGATPAALHGLVPVPVGRVHVLHVARDVRQEPRRPVRLPEPDGPVRAARGQGLDGLGARSGGSPASKASSAALSAIYLAMAEVLNEVKGRTVLPIGTSRRSSTEGFGRREPICPPLLFEEGGGLLDRLQDAPG